MADDMCGPSNALQSFQKHSTVDRTLQQDRLLSRPSPSQGFRSSPGPSAALANREFDAFQAGHFSPEPQPFHPGAFSHAHPPPQLQQPGPSGWASDFQRLNISPPPQQLNQLFTPQQQDAGGWHQEFARQNNQIPTPTHQSSPFQYSPMRQMGMNYNAQSFTPQSQASMSIEKQPEAFDDEAFARAFEEAARNEGVLRQDPEMVQNNTQEQGQDQEQSADLGQDILINESATRLLSRDSDVLSQQAPIGADQIHNPSSPEREPRQEDTDPDALARTAGQLLNSVQHDSSAKFQNSQFLELMRGLRDREVMVMGDTFVGAEDGVSGADAERGVTQSYPSPPEVSA
ncbi:hypothetical protein LHYA1_G002432 [Lachnellula hyalina]|uniref:Peroxin 20 n=1 Tax=Lachnellula hyalina TaxID=1316788 RepID=A0A8H8R633_9HELO|nr:uncharacterized protein LHYA1_G002432 [Lachnellula hyalina]TVY28681.1 hypothetical protein LHYA1_G002432 [Lachnellula hyalina]